jgi:hypothetical protein
MRAIEIARKAWEALDPAVFDGLFTNLTAVVKGYRCGPSEVWNEDEAGVRIGCFNGRTLHYNKRRGRAGAAA